MALPLFHVNPSSKTRIATCTNSATIHDVEQAVAIAQKAWPAWRDLPLETRAARINDLGARLEKDRLRLTAMEVHEQAKPWREADADVAEAVDFCRYYACQSLVELRPRVQGHLPGEANSLTYEGRGLCAVIAPWNFPLAILCGMTTAALVAGNAVLLKPAEQASAIAHAFHRHALDAGIPAEVLALLPGDGAIVGDALVRHPDIVQIAFTGSREVGTTILRQAAEIVPGQSMIKRVVCEMGGKNAIIVDDDADLDEAVTGVMTSAFGYAGQKCSACSRLIVVASIHKNFVQRLKLAAEALVPASAARADCLVPPVIDEASYERLGKVIRELGDDAQLIYRGERGPGSAGWFVPPAIFEVTDPGHPLMQDELFGPILTVFAARDFSHALAVANNSAFALTGAVYSRSPNHLQQAREEFRVGNLYLNRPCTGALVDRQPFGGFKMSGAGTKAGGPGYLLNFAEMHVCTENTMRRGFAPEDFDGSPCRPTSLPSAAILFQEDSRPYLTRSGGSAPRAVQRSRKIARRFFAAGGRRCGVRKRNRSCDFSGASTAGQCQRGAGVGQPELRAGKLEPLQRLMTKKNQAEVPMRFHFGRRTETK